MLNLTDHDSMSGEHVGNTSRLIVTSGKSDIWPLATPKNKGLRNLQKSPKEGKRPGQKLIKHMRGGRTLPSMLGKDCESSYCYENC